MIDALPRKTVEESDREQIGTDCPICFNAYAANDTLIELPCKHEFHDECITHWLKDANTCPLCRAVVQREHEELHDDERPTFEEGMPRAEEEFPRIRELAGRDVRPLGAIQGTPTIRVGDRGDLNVVGGVFNFGSNFAEELNHVFQRRPVAGARVADAERDIFNLAIQRSFDPRLRPRSLDQDRPGAAPAAPGGTPYGHHDQRQRR